MWGFGYIQDKCYAHVLFLENEENYSDSMKDKNANN